MPAAPGGRSGPGDTLGSLLAFETWKVCCFTTAIETSHILGATHWAWQPKVNGVGGHGASVWAGAAADTESVGWIHVTSYWVLVPYPCKACLQTRIGGWGWACCVAQADAAGKQHASEQRRCSNELQGPCRGPGVHRQCHAMPQLAESLTLWTLSSNATGSVSWLHTQVSCLCSHSWPAGGRPVAAWRRLARNLRASQAGSSDHWLGSAIQGQGRLFQPSRARGILQWLWGSLALQAALAWQSEMELNFCCYVRIIHNLKTENQLLFAIIWIFKFWRFFQLLENDQLFDNHFNYLKIDYLIIISIFWKSAILYHIIRYLFHT